MIKNNIENGNAVGPLGRCPQCSQPAQLGAQNPWRPFCCERCRQLDFGAWIAERYTIAESGEETPPAPADHQLQ
ncbi:MAG TPA: DNA gyrase inhibitor YacG [Nevskiaceae bacterium]|nr:DNA gyrase inhibitor YacG [Nevskiaceae bacterium]